MSQTDRVKNYTWSSSLASPRGNFFQSSPSCETAQPSLQFQWFKPRFILPNLHIQLEANRSITVSKIHPGSDHFSLSLTHLSRSPISWAPTPGNCLLIFLFLLLPYYNQFFKLQVESSLTNPNKIMWFPRLEPYSVFTPHSEQSPVNLLYPTRPQQSFPSILPPAYHVPDAHTF